MKAFLIALLGILPCQTHAALDFGRVEVLRLAEGMVSLEGPAWDRHHGALYFSRQSKEGAIFRWTASEGVSPVRSFAYKVNGNTFDAEGRLINCESSAAADPASRRIVRYERDGSTTVLVDNLNGETLNQPNDVIADSKGRIWFTTPSWSKDEHDRQFIIRHDPASSTTERLAWLDKCNGLALSPDEKTLYVVVWGSPGSQTHNKVVAYPIDAAGSLGDPSDLVTGLEHGADGMTLDKFGNLFIAVGNGPMKGIRIHAPDGAYLGAIQLPESARDVTNCCFGGPDAFQLFITAGPELYRADMSGVYENPKCAAAP